MVRGDKWGEVSNGCRVQTDNVKTPSSLMTPRCVRVHPGRGPQGVKHLVKSHEFHPVAVIDSHPSTEASHCNWKVAAAGARPHRPHAQSWCSSCSVWLRGEAARRRAVNTVSDLSSFWSSPAALGWGIPLVSVWSLFLPARRIMGRVLSMETTIYRWIKKQLPQHDPSRFTQIKRCVGNKQMLHP